MVETHSNASLLKFTKIMLYLIICFLFWNLCGGLFPALTEAKEKHTVKVIGIGEVYFTGNKTIDQAKKEAKEYARMNAIEQVAGIEVTSQQLSYKTETQDKIFDHFSELIHTRSFGKTSNEKVIYEDIQIVDQKAGIFKAIVKIEADVGIEQGEPDPSFSIHIELNQETFREGEEMIITLKSTKDCYVHLFNVLSNDTVLTLFPNPMLNNNFVAREKPIKIPSDSLRNIGFHIRMSLLPGKKEDGEMLLVIATKDNFPFTSKKPINSGFQGMNYFTAYTELNRWLLNIPIDKRTEDSVVYRIIKR